MPKYFMPIDAVTGNEIRLVGENARHLNVARAKAGEEAIICDGQYTNYFCVVKSIQKELAVLEVIEKRSSEEEPKTKITLFQALTKGDKMDLVIQKCVEIGVYSIVPVEMERCVAKAKETKNDRWQRVSEAAAKQCGRGIIPRINKTVSFDCAVDMAREFDISLAAYENERMKSLKDAMDGNYGSVGVFIGPEGGLSESEILKFHESNIISFSLGKRILRTETAGLASVLLILFIQGDL